jgi:hypothetical protein
MTEMRSLWCAVVTGVLVLTACASGNEREVDPAACERLREHLIDVRFDGNAERQRVHRAAARDALGDDFVRRCVAETSPERLRCAMTASTVDAVRACSTSEVKP